jgi:hypothetical protein
MKAKWLFIALFSLILTSCITQRRCSIKFPSVNDTIKITTVKDSIVIRDTTIFIKIPGEKVTDSISIPCPEVHNYIPKKVCAETQLASACAWWQYPVIKLELMQKDTTIVKRLNRALKESYYWRTLYEKVHITPAPVKYVPGFYKGCLWILIGEILVIALFIAFKKFIK